ncbi:MAG: hypothetical protein A2301_01330 [Candidatus Magasanikbacteria bacterium RIFOXYB2_FULL_40_13]|uniref:Uncharacterized protein n=1 Tax=Candidatus Magasanikbacteria bacterium RIFOXYB1_FULL_40_15 TaxID=1798697 RepID=A0A1F6NG54_9BACT|nr:MAG: hypothetical protein A2373_00585 [Candidatus Magasanikbacteria bacterium RIFOXYB1_FULL_40_15]OGH86587.1 MAG: hypothetical protein A2301_01330 [Candidatus Magasanikbacteria bacterium RIFOXYB2_FULL_40_13]
MNTQVKCPACGAVGKIYGLPYGLQIMSSAKGENTDVDSVVLIHCEECGVVLGGYSKELER